MRNLLSFIFILGAIGLFFGYVNPVYRAETGSTEVAKKSIKELRQERAQYLDALGKTREIELARTGLLTRYNAIAEEDREKLRKLVPDHIDSVRLILELTNLAEQHRMTLRNFHLMAKDVGAGDLAAQVIGPTETRFKAVTLSFSTTATYENFREFVKNLEESLRVVDISDVSVRAESGEEYEYGVTIRTYHLGAAIPPGSL